MSDLLTEMVGKVNVVKGAVADKAITVIEEYRAGKHHGREVSAILAELFESTNDTVEWMLAQAVNKTKEGQDKNNKVGN